MKVKDEVGGQTRIDAVHAALEEVPADPRRTGHGAERLRDPLQVLDSGLQRSREQVLAQRSADGKRSDYGTFLNRTFDRWQGERFIRGLLLVGDGVDNGEAFSSAAEAAKWGRRGVPVTTFTVGREDSNPDAKDIVVTGVECEPSPAPIKTDVTVIGNVNAFGFAGTRLVARVYFDGKLRSRKRRSRSTRTGTTRCGSP